MADLTSMAQQMVMLKAHLAPDSDGNAESHLTDSDGSAEEGSLGRAEGSPDLDGTEGAIDDGSLKSDDIHKGSLDLDSID